VRNFEIMSGEFVAVAVENIQRTDHQTVQSVICSSCPHHIDRKCEGKQTFKFFPDLPVKVRVKLSLCLTKRHAMKTCWGSEGIAPRIL
jgi:hypothetical protein